MAQTSVAQLASDLKMPAGVLLEQLQKAGVSKSTADDVLSEQDKARLLEFLRRSHGEGEAKTKITLTRRETSEINSQDSHGKSHTVQVEVRKKRVLVKRDIPELRAEVAAVPQPVAAPEPVVAEAVAAVVEPVVVINEVRQQHAEEGAGGIQDGAFDAGGVGQADVEEHVLQ